MPAIKNPINNKADIVHVFPHKEAIFSAFILSLSTRNQAEQMKNMLLPIEPKYRNSCRIMIVGSIDEMLASKGICVFADPTV